MNFRKIWDQYKGRIIFSILGLIIGILFLTIGFWRTIFLLFVTLLGYFIGVVLDKRLLETFWGKIREIFFMRRF
ncbi:MAG TPA: DUF2273 domain-containing protein [Dictyoglomaceae bacterium]|nr:DUF2273 domain-containing protein [Dictyoglomaceae bacterium]HOL38776.1 DUF2273 domain-containing protein [Dictyoglomaceae bacterium]HPP15475.1 DUF2273 domain-containing protein [Dictyoglomaceae bacterium]